MEGLIIIVGIIIIITCVLLLSEYYLLPKGEVNLIINKENILNVKPGKNVLNYLFENKIFIPSACGGKATCGFCKVKVLSGGGKILPTEEVFLSRNEKISGFRLACQVKVKEDIEIYIPPHLLGAEEYEAKVVKLENLTHDIKLVVLKLNKIINFKPGQYIQFKIPGTDEFRAYSIASPPSKNDIIELIVRLVPGGLCSTYIHEILMVGEIVNLIGPFGEFYLREESNRDIIAIAGGCGMAPVKSIIYHLTEKGMPRKFLYFFGARQKKDLFYTEELMEIEKKYKNFKYIPALSEPKAYDKWEGEIGLITQVVERYIEDASNFEAYLCGPPPMIDAAIKVLTRKGLPEKFIYYDKF